MKTPEQRLGEFKERLADLMAEYNASLYVGVSSISFGQEYTIWLSIMPFPDEDPIHGYDWEHLGDNVDKDSLRDPLTNPK